MTDVDFQCPSCGNDLKLTMAQLKVDRHMICPGCSIGINIDTDRMANAAEEIHKATEKSPPELDFADFFSCLLQTPAQKIAASAMMRTACSTGAAVRPRGSNGAHRSFQSDQ